MSKPWAGVGAWALETERAEAEERELAAAAAAFSSGGPTLLDRGPAQSFPSLKEAASKSRKKKGISLSLSEFNTGTYDGPCGTRREPALEPKGLTHEVMLHLPTGPRENTSEELNPSRLGGGFGSYGYGLGAGGGAAHPRRRSEFGMDDEERRAPRASVLDQPSRADAVDSWTAGKKFAPAMDSSRKKRYGYLGNGGSSKADEVDNWSMEKKSTAPPPPYRNSGFGYGFRDFHVPAADSDRWVRGARGSLSSNVEGERPRLVLDPPKRDSGSRPEPAHSRPSPFGAARPREEVLAEKGLDWRKLETEIEVKRTAGPTSSQSSRPSSVQSSRAESLVSQVSGEGGAPKPRPRVNPFGDAKPREVLLEQKGMDWRKIDLELEHRGVERPETNEEKMMKEEIEHLKKKLSTEQLSSLHEQIKQKEKQLEQLIHELDDKVRFGQKIRPGSGSGRIPFSADRPPFRSSNLDDSGNMERPRSRGMGDSWSRPIDKGLGFPQSWDSVYLSSRSSDMLHSRRVN